MLNPSEVEKTLEILGKSSPPTDSDVVTVQSSISKLWDNLFKANPFSYSASPDDHEAIIKSVSEKPKQTFFIALSDTLKSDPANTVSLWNDRLKSYSSCDGDEVNLNELSAIRDIYMSQHTAGWLLLQEVLRIDLDSSHVMHTAVSKAVDDLLNRGLFEETLKLLHEILPEWQPASIPREHFPTTSTAGSASHTTTSSSYHTQQELSTYIMNIQYNWTIDYITEYQHCIEILILLSYSRRNFHLYELTEFLIKFITQSIHINNQNTIQILLNNYNNQNNIQYINKLIEKMKFFGIILFIENLQFWRLLQNNIEIKSEHPLLNNNTTTSNNNDNDIQENIHDTTEILYKYMFKYTTTTTNNSTIKEDEHILYITLTIWCYFIQGFSEYNEFLTEFIQTNIYEKFQNISKNANVLTSLNNLTNTVFSSRSRLTSLVLSYMNTTSSTTTATTSTINQYAVNRDDVVLLTTEPNTFIYCSILQELLNIFISYHTIQTEANTLIDLEATVGLVELTYRTHDQLCGSFWNAWMEYNDTFTVNTTGEKEEKQHYYPLCQLVYILLQTTPHDPIYLYRILTALACSTQACMSIIEMLNQPVYSITYEPMSTLLFQEPSTGSTTAEDGSERVLQSGSYDALQWDNAAVWMREHDDLPPAAGTLAMKINNTTTTNMTTTSSNNTFIKQFKHGKGGLVPEPFLVLNNTNTSESMHPSINTPIHGSKGFVIDYIPHTKSYIVQWNNPAQWWTLLFDQLIQFLLSEKKEFYHIQNFNLIMIILKLFNTVLKQKEQLNQIISFLEIKWNEISLFMLLKNTNNMELYSFFSEKNINILKLHSDYSITYDYLLYHMNIPRYTVECILSKLKNSSKYENIWYRNSFNDVLAHVSAIILQYSIHNIYTTDTSTNTNHTRITSMTNNTTISDYTILINTYDLHNTMCSVSPAWANCWNKQAYSVFSSGTNSTSLYESIHNLTIDTTTSTITMNYLPELYYLTSSYILQQCEVYNSNNIHIHSKLHALHGLFQMFDLSNRGFILIPDLVHGLNARGLPVSTEQMLGLLENLNISTSMLDYSDFIYLTTGINTNMTTTSGSTNSGSSNNKDVYLHEFRTAIVHIATATSDATNTIPESFKYAIILQLNQFNRLYKSTYIIGKNIEEHCFLLLQTLHSIYTTIHHKSELYSFIMEQISMNAIFLETIVHLALNLGILSRKVGNLSSQTVPISFKDMLNRKFSTTGSTNTASTPIIVRTLGAVLPLDFSSLASTTTSSPKQAETTPMFNPIVVSALHKISEEALKIILILTNASSPISATATVEPVVVKETSPAEVRACSTVLTILTKPCPTAFNGLTWLTDRVSSTAKTSTATTITLPVAQGTHLSFLLGLLNCPTATARSKKMTLTMTIRVLHMLLPSTGTNSSSIIDCFGPENLSAIVSSLHDCLQCADPTASDATSTCGSTVRSVALELLLEIAKLQPAAFCLLLNSKKSTTVASTTTATTSGSDGQQLSGNDSFLVHSLLKLLTEADNLYTDDPQTLHLLYELMIVMCRATDYQALLKAALYMVQTKKFWDFVTVPLMLDVPPLPDLTVTHQLYHPGLFQVSNSRNTEKTMYKQVSEWLGAEGNNPFSLENEINLHCWRLHCHASALILLSIERYGVFYEIDSSIAIHIAKKLQLFYIKATESHRFVSWIKHYLSISIDAKMQESLIQTSEILGVPLSTTTSNSTGSTINYGLNFAYNTNSLQLGIKNQLVTALTTDISLASTDQIDIYLLNKLVVSIQQYNLSFSLSTASLQLIQSWRQFLEFYVLPGSVIKQQHQQRERSGSDTHRGRKHSFDETNTDNNSNNSPTVGTLSPLTSAQIQSSPLANKKSSFIGDKRSYEIVTEIILQLEYHRKDNCILTIIGRKAIIEKSELLVSMLHHQLKTVTSRASDPSKSVTISRDIGSLRLTQEKMEKLLEKLDDIYKDLVFSFQETTTSSTSSSSNSSMLLHEYKNIIALRLLTSMMLLLNSIYTFNSADDVYSKLSQRRRSIYMFAITALRNLLITHGISILSNTSKSNINTTNNNDEILKNSDSSSNNIYEECKSNLTTPTTPTTATTNSNIVSTNSYTIEQSIAQICLQIVKLSLPRSSIQPLISLTDHVAWRNLLSETKAMSLFSNIITQLSVLTSNMPVLEHTYSGWRASALTAGHKGKSETGPHRHIPYSIPYSSYEEQRSMLLSLLYALDALHNSITTNIISIQNIEEINILINIFINSPLLRNYQQVLLRQADEGSGILMGYQCNTAEISYIATSWLRTVNLLESIVQRFETSSIELESTNQSNVTTIDLQNTICKFIHTYADLLLLPMSPATQRYSVQQLTLMRASMNLFNAVNSKLSIWKLHLSQIYIEVQQRVLMLSKVFSLLLWHGEDQESFEQQRRLLDYCIAISAIEKREGHSMQTSRRTRRRSGSIGGSTSTGSKSTISGIRTPDAHVHFGENTVHVFGDSIMKSPGLGGSSSDPSSSILTPTRKSRKPMGFYSALHTHNSGMNNMDTVEGLQDTIIEFLLDIEAHIVAVMTPLSAFLRHITPIPLEVVRFDDYGRPLFPVGNHIYYESEHMNDGSSMLLEGVVSRIYDQGERFDVVLVDDMVERNVHASQVKYTSAPIIQYLSLSDLAKHSIEDSSIVQTSYHGHREVTNALSTAHLLRSLQLATSALTNTRLQAQILYPQAAQDLSVLAGQLAWLIVSNIAHHALAPMGHETSMIHQLNDLKRAIRPRETVQHSTSSSAASTAVVSGSTSPFVSYLDQGLRTPLGTGTLTPTSSFTSAGSNMGSSNSSIKWMYTAEWTQYVSFLDKWCEEIFYMLGRGATLETAEEEEEEESPAARIRKKRIGLRARIEWVQSPEEV